MNRASKTNNIFKILFFITVPLILVGATIIVLIISQGGSVTNEGIVGDYGVIRINTDPLNIDYNLFIDNKLVENLTNKGTNLKAGEHLLRIEAQGMSTWEKEVSITKGIVNEVFAKLFPEELSLIQLTNTNIQKAFINTNGDYVFYVINQSEINENVGIWRMQLATSNLPFLNNPYNTNKLASLNATTLELVNKNNYELIPSPDNNKVLLIDNDSKASFVINAQNPTQATVTIDLATIFGYIPENVNWFRNSNSLLISHQGLLFEYNLESEVTTLIKYNPNELNPFSANTSQVVYFDKISSKLFIYKSERPSDIILTGLETPTTIEAVYLPSRSNRFFAIKSNLGYQLVDLDKNTISNMIAENIELIMQSPDGLGYIFKSETALLSLTIKENIGLNILEFKTTTLDFMLNAEDKLKYVPQSNCLLYYNHESKTLYTADRDGLNRLVLLESENINGTFNFDVNASNLILTMKAEPQVNLYRMNLLK